MAADKSAKKKPNWKKIAGEYIKGDIAMCPLARKHKVPITTLKDHARREHWSERRTAYRAETGFVAVKKTSNRGEDPPARVFVPDEEDVGHIGKIFQAEELLVERIIETLQNEKYIDGRELSAIATAISKCKEIRHLRDALDIREQEARIASLERTAAPAGCESVQIEFVGEAKEAAV